MTTTTIPVVCAEQTERETSSRAELTAATALAGLGNVHDFSPRGKAITHELPHDTAENEPCLSEDKDQSKDKELIIPQRYTKSGRQRSIPFALKLMKVLSNKKYSHIISWMPSGKSFMIHKPKLFAVQVLPFEFKQAKHSSFTRKLHRWGFMRHYRGDEAGAFFHKDFQAGRLDLAEKMSCYTANGKSSDPVTVEKPPAISSNTHNNAVAVKPKAVRAPILDHRASSNQPPTSLPLSMSATTPTNVSFQGFPMDIDTSMDYALRDINTQTLVSIQNHASVGLRSMIQTELRRRLFILQEQQQREAKLNALKQQQQFLLPTGPYHRAWNEPAQNLDQNRLLIALASRNIAQQRHQLSTNNAFNSMNIKPDNRICYATHRSTLPPINTEAAKTA